MIVDLRLSNKTFMIFLSVELRANSVELCDTFLGLGSTEFHRVFSESH